jgi:hypothetical protein
VHVVVGGVLFVEVYDGDRFVRKEGVGAFVEHFRRVAPHYGSHLHVQVAHHGVAMPATQHANVVRVDLTTE